MMLVECSLKRSATPEAYHLLVRLDPVNQVNQVSTVGGLARYRLDTAGVVSKVCQNCSAGIFGGNHKLLRGNGVGEIRTHGTRKGTLVFKHTRPWAAFSQERV